MLSNVKDRHHQVKGMGDDVNGNPHLHEILEEHEGVDLVHVVGAGDHGDQLITQYEGDDHPRNGDDHRVGEASDHGKDASIGESRDLQSG